MIRSRVVLALSLLIALASTACMQAEMPPVRIETSITASVDYLDDVAPILERRWVVCHSCYNAACQLKLGSIEGIERGGTQDTVYDGARLVVHEPMFVSENHPNRFNQCLAVGLDRKVLELPVLLGNHRQCAARRVYVDPDVPFHPLAACRLLPPLRWVLLITQLKDVQRCREAPTFLFSGTRFQLADAMAQ